MPFSPRRITKAAIDRLKPGDILRDTELKGFGARRQTGAPVYFLQKRIDRRLKWLTIGTHGAPWTPETARREALRLVSAIASGGNPQAEKEKQRARPLLSETAEMFLAEHVAKLKPATREKYIHLLTRYILPLLGQKRAADVGRADVSRLHGQMAHYPRLANYAVAVLSKCMSWCEEYGIRPERSNPCLGLKKYAEKRRHRYLSAEEYARLGEALAAAERHGGEDVFIVAALRLLILTGARLSEMLTLKWEYVDLDRRLLILPDSKTGQKMIGLNGHALAVLLDLPQLQNNPYVIPGRRTGCHLVNLQKPWRRIRAEAGLADVRLHDLRHSFASVAALSNASLPKIGRLLGHMDSRTTARYAHLSDVSVSTLNESVGGLITQAMNGGRASTP